MEGHLKMSAKERQRLNLFVRVKRGELQHNEAALLCETRVSLLAYQTLSKQGDRGLVHQRLGDHQIGAPPAEFRRRCWHNIRKDSVGPKLAAEKLALEGWVDQTPARLKRFQCSRTYRSTRRYFDAPLPLTPITDHSEVDRLTCRSHYFCVGSK